jgi:arylsulfatase A-like enzyme
MKAMNFKILFLSLLALCFQIENIFASGKPPARPNIIFFLVDDMGWMDCSVYGSKYYETPNIDRLSKRGIVFNNAYTASPLCSPTRASIMTGKYPERFHLTTPAGHLAPNPDAPLMKDSAVEWNKVVCPDSRTFMPLEEFTIAEALKNAGYTTAHIGKWHLGQEAYWPEHQGFDVNIAGGSYPGPPSFFSPYKNVKLSDGPDKEYLTDRITDEALNYIETHSDAPFFLNFWHFAVHAPYQGQMDLIRKYEQKKDPRGMQDNAIMGAMIESMDKSLGRLIDKLVELKMDENTIFIFFSDNGGNMYDLINGKTATNNFPLKMGKGNIHEGGIRVPCIISWPGTIKPNQVSEQLISSIDFYPTLLDIAGLKPRENQILDGVSLYPMLLKGKTLKKRELYCHFPHYIPATDNYPSTSVRSGDWKLIRVYGEDPGQMPSFELFNLKTDIGENNNLAASNPELVAKLDKLIENHVNKTQGISPIVNPKYKPGTESPMGIKPVFPIEDYPSY